MAAVDVFVFGPYRLIAAERLLLKEEKAVNVGSRALDVLIALAEDAGEVVSQRDLMARAWPDVVVGNGSLRVTIAELRKTLGDGQNGARYISNVTGRGYSLVKPLVRAAASPSQSYFLSSDLVPVSKHRLPARLARMIGRDETVASLSALVRLRRFVSIVGSGGLGKTTIAISVAHTLLADFGSAVYFVDLGTVDKAALVLSAVAAVLGLSAEERDPLASLLDFLADRRILLVLDNCEHVIDTVAILAERLYNDAPQVHILTTSREALRAEGEHVHLLIPLDYPPVQHDMTAAEALSFPAVQLFMERAFASGFTSDLTDVDAPAVAAICRRLDGIALAIELAGSRVGTYGLRETAHLLSNRFGLLWQGRRTVLPRHQTLHGMLDWSFNLLSERDRSVLIRLSIFVGVFTLEAAQTVATDNPANVMEVANAFTSLVDKSLICVASIDGITYYRLLDSTAAFAAEKLSQTTHGMEVARRHALYYEQWRSSNPAECVAVSGVNTAALVPHIGNIRAALEWCFSCNGDPAIGVRLAAASAPLFLALSFLVECRRWCEQALALQAEGCADMATQLVLQEALATSAMFTRGNGDDVRRVIENGLRLADALGDSQRQLNLLAGKNIFLTRVGDFHGAMAVAQRSIVIAQKVGSPAAIATGEWMLGVAHHLVGDQVNAQWHCERGLEKATASQMSQATYFGYDHRIRGLVALARTLWLRGYPDRADRTATRAIDEAAKQNNPVDLCIAMIYAATVFLWRGDLHKVEQLIQRLGALATRRSLAPYHAVGLALSGELAIACGDPANGVITLRRALEVLQSEQHHILTSAFHRALAEGLLALGQMNEALTVLDAVLHRDRNNANALDVAELLRIRGEILMKTANTDPGDTERALQLSLQQARLQSTLSLELRSGMALARLWSSRGRSADAIDLLRAIYKRFEEGYDTKDLKLAARILIDLGHCCTALDTPGDSASYSGNDRAYLR